MKIKITYRRSDILKLIRKDIQTRGGFEDNDFSCSTKTSFYGKDSKILCSGDIYIYIEAEATTKKEALLPIPEISDEKGEE